MHEREHWTVVIVHSLMIAALAAAFGAPAFAQGETDSVAVTPTCSDSVRPGATYARCALWLDGSSLRRGSDTALVARASFFRSLRLSPYLLGDSARAYARLYERDVRRANLLYAASLVVTGAAVILLNSYHCRPEPPFGICANNDNLYVIGTGVLLGAGFGFAFGSIPFTARAQRAAARALWWHNANFGR